MQTTILRTGDGSVVLAIPAAILERLHLKEGAAVGVCVENGRLVVEPNPRPRYTMAELLAGSDYSQPLSPEEREWLDAPAVGREVL